MTDQNRKINKMALAGFILVLLSITPLVFFRYFVGEWFTWALLFSLVVLSPVGLVLSVIGLVHSIKNKEKGKFFYYFSFFRCTVCRNEQNLMSLMEMSKPIKI